MDALDILVRTLSIPAPMGASKTLWQYHSRSDRHSKIACWGVLFDLLQTSNLLRSHVADGTVVFGVNHVMRDFVNNKKKSLDLVLCRPGNKEGAQKRSPATLVDLADRWHISLTADQQARMKSMPSISEGPVGAVLIALEAKATMTEHIKAGPRLYDELNSSHQIVHASSSKALSVGFFMVNASSSFISPDRNKGTAPGKTVTIHKQPAAAAFSTDVVGGLPRRSGASGTGYDGMAIVVIDMPNDGVTPVKLVRARPAPQPGEIFNYESMLTRIANEYDATFSRI
ncbi:MAG TPA: hypothetical protein VK586_26470 [Streptosporangiaceae bacterium]|nr:hypothetical protein [Streptosporangiaceae bacterium]